MNKSKFAFLTQHLRDVNETYVGHGFHAIAFGLVSCVAGIILFIHAIFPFAFLVTGSNTIAKLAKVMSIRAKRVRLKNSGDKKIAIIGFGLSGLLAFKNLVQQHQTGGQTGGKKLTIHVYDSSRHIPKGVAYSTKNPNHLLNVPACRMGVDENDRRHFFNWLQENGYNYAENDFVPRQIFGIYLEDVLQQALKMADVKGIAHHFFASEVQQITVTDNFYLTDEDAYSHCILATGIKLRNWSKNFWNVDLKNYLSLPEIHLSGCGLTAFDAAIALRDAGYDKKIFMHARTGKMPHVHKIPDASEKFESPLSLADADLPLSQIAKKFTSACRKSSNWRGNFDAFRSLTQQFWNALSAEKKQRFLRHCMRLWGVHRHRVPPSQFAIIEQMMQSGQLSLVRQRTSEKDAIDCTGFDFDFSSPLVSCLLAAHVIKYDNIKTSFVSQRSNCYLMGGLNFGTYLELTATPEITAQGHQVAKQILG